MTATRTVIEGPWFLKNVAKTLFWGDHRALSLTLGQVRSITCCFKESAPGYFWADNTRRSSFALTCCWFVIVGCSLSWSWLKPCLSVCLLCTFHFRGSNQIKITLAPVPTRTCTAVPSPFSFSSHLPCYCWYSFLCRYHNNSSNIES